MNCHVCVCLAVVLTSLSLPACGNDRQNVKDASQDPNRAVITVVDRQGNVLTDVDVVDCETQEQYTTDAQGRFACRSSDQRQFFYAVDEQRGLALVAQLPGGARQLTMELNAAQMIRGRVTDPNGRPVFGALVASEPVTSVCVPTDEEGQFCIGLLPSNWGARGICLLARHIERDLAAMVDISGQAARVDVQLAPALSLSGTVTAVEGTPLAGATVSVCLKRWNWEHYMPVKRAVADANGRFTLPALPQLQQYDLRVRAAGYATEFLTTGVISTVKEREELGTIVLTKVPAPETPTEMGRLRIRIVDEDRKPVDATSAQMWRKRPESEPDAETVLLVSSRTPGLYEIEPLPIGKYHALSLDVEGFARFWLPDVEVRTEPQETITCRLSRGGTIAGVVTDDAGKPLAGLPVVIDSALCKRELTTDPNGRFVTDHLPDVRYSVVVEPEVESAYATAVLIGGASCGAEDLRIVVQPKMEVKAPTSLVGANLWDWSQLSLPLERSSVAHQAILLCLCDMNQRPSRNCVRQLGAGAKELKERGVVVVVVQVASASQAELSAWIKENGIAFPLGSLRDVESSTLIAARVKTLPWLILADETHTVVAEGFAVADLESQLIKAGANR